MIVVKLAGGLGNQMFQYAIGRHLSLKYNTKLALDLSLLKALPKDTNYTIRNYELDVFNVKCSFFDLKLPRSLKLKQTDILNRLAFKLVNYKVISEKEYYNFDEKIFNSSKNAYIIGYWQSAKYFDSIRDTLIADFKFKIQPNELNNTHIKEIESSNSISVHIRRGDYITNEIANSTHGICNLRYYQDAIEQIKSKVSDPHFFFFSDDIEWVKEQFKALNNTTFINNNTDKGFEDLRLMTLCKHHIIANSSFSWWGAWLSLNYNKIVIAPKNWTTFGLSKQQEESVYCKDWIII